MQLRQATIEEIKNAETIDAAFQAVRETSGLRYTALRPLPAQVTDIRAKFSVFFVDLDADFGVPQFKDYDLTIDGQPVTERKMAIIDITTRAFHEAKLTLGKHSIEVSDPDQADRVLYDGDILVNGIDEVRLIVERSSKYPTRTSRSLTEDIYRVMVRKGVDAIFDSTSP